MFLYKVLFTSREPILQCHELLVLRNHFNLSLLQVVKQLWVYIRSKNLQDPSNKRNIICDEALRALFRVDSINMFQMNKALSKHIWPLESDDGTASSIIIVSSKKASSSSPSPLSIIISQLFSQFDGQATGFLFIKQTHYHQIKELSCCLYLDSFALLDDGVLQRNGV